MAIERQATVISEKWLDVETTVIDLTWPDLLVSHAHAPKRARTLGPAIVRLLFEKET